MFEDRDMPADEPTPPGDGSFTKPSVIGESGLRSTASTDETQRWEAYLFKVKGDLLHHMAALTALLANPADSVALSPEVISELNLVKSMVDIYSARSAEDLEDSKTGFSDLDLR
jgi:hypothetical protein